MCSSFKVTVEAAEPICRLPEGLQTAEVVSSGSAEDTELGTVARAQRYTAVDARCLSSTSAVALRQLISYSLRVRKRRGCD